MCEHMSGKSDWKGVSTYFVYHFDDRTLVEDRRFRIEIVGSLQQEETKIRLVLNFGQLNGSYA